MKIILAMLSVLLLSDCAPRSTSYINGQQCGFTQEFFGGRDCREEEMQSQMSQCGMQKTWIERTQCRRSTLLNYHNDPNNQEFSAYMGLIIEKVKNHKMTEAQAEYALQQKKAQINQRSEAAYAQDRQLSLIERGQDMQAEQERQRSWQQLQQENSDRLLNAAKRPAIYQRPSTTNCSPDGYGGMRCSTY